MTTIQYNRRNFLSSLAILSAGSAFGSTLKHFSPAADSTTRDLQKKWRAFWKKSGGRVFYSFTDLNAGNDRKETKGHYYKYGEVIYFPKENILAQPTWISWSDHSKPVDVVVTLFENNQSFKKILSLNRYEMEALYHVSKEPDPELLFLTSVNNGKHIAGASAGIITTTTRIKRNSQVQDISYYKGPLLIFKHKLIHHI